MHNNCVPHVAASLRCVSYDKQHAPRAHVHTRKRKHQMHLHAFPLMMPLSRTTEQDH